MDNYITYLCKLYRSDDDEFLDDVVLRSLPRAGERIWFEHHDDDGYHDYDMMVNVDKVVHVGETDDSFPYVQLDVTVIDQQKVEYDSFSWDFKLDEYDSDFPQVVYECENCKFRTNVPNNKCCAYTKQVVVA